MIITKTSVVDHAIYDIELHTNSSKFTSQVYSNPTTFFLNFRERPVNFLLCSAVVFDLMKVLERANILLKPNIN